MDNPTTLLVAIMYVTIVATGLVNVLLAFLIRSILQAIAG